MDEQHPDQLTTERLESMKAISKLHPGNRFRLMFGKPPLPEPHVIEAAETLRQHNIWRRYNGDDSPPMQCPRKLGEAIDTLVNHILNDSQP